MNLKKKKGQALLETAIILPIFILFFCGIVDFGRILYTSNQLNLVTQEAVRLSGLGKSDYYVTQYAKSKVSFADAGTMVVKFNPPLTPPATARTPGSYVTVIMDYNVQYITPFMKFILPSPFKVETKSTVRVE